MFEYPGVTLISSAVYPFSLYTYVDHNYMGAIVSQNNKGDKYSTLLSDIFFLSIEL